MKTKHEIALEYKKVCESYDKYNSICSTDSHWGKVFMDVDILDFISKSVDFEVTPELMKKALKRNKTKLVSKNTVKPTQSGKNKFNGQLSSKGMNDLVGRFDCDFKNLLISSVSSSPNSRKPTRSEVYRVEYDSRSSRYKIYAYEISKDGNEMPNVFTLKDVVDGKTFYHYFRGDQEGLASLGVNIVSLKGFPLKKYGSACYDMTKTDALGLHNNRGKMTVAMYDGTKQLSRFFFNNCFLEAFFNVLTNLGYVDDVWDCIIGLMSVLENETSITLPNGKVVSKDKVLISKFELIGDSNKLSKYHKIVSYKNQAYICYNRDINVKKDSCFELMKTVLSYIAKKYGYKLDDLLRCVTFYGGHDYVHQGDDASNYFNTNPNYSTLSVNSNKPVATVSNTSKTTDNFVMYDKSTFEKQLNTDRVSKIRFTYNNYKSILTPSKNARVTSYFRNGDIIYSIMAELIKNGVSLDTILSINKCMFKVENVYEEAHSSNYHLDLGDGKFFYDNGNIGVPQVASSLNALVSKRLGFEVEFEFVSKK